MCDPRFHFAWDRFCRYTYQYPWPRRYHGLSESESCQFSLPESWERLCAPCKCSFVEGSSRGLEEAYLGSDNIYWEEPCPLKNSQLCSVRMLYINHTTGEATLHCPCATCSPDWKAAPCLTLDTLFGGDDPCFLNENSDDPLIPAQDLTKVGKSCWRLGDLFDDESVPHSWDIDVDPIIPAQDVGLHIFDDMPGFALAKNHPLLSTAQEPSLKVQQPSLAERTPVIVQSPPLASSQHNDLNHILQGHRPSFKYLLPTFPTSVSMASLLSYFVEYTATSSTRFPYDPRLPLSWSEMMEAFIALVLSVLLVFAYECVNIYIYLRDLPSPPLFMSKLVGFVLLVVGWRVLRCHFGVV